MIWEDVLAKFKEKGIKYFIGNGNDCRYGGRMWRHSRQQQCSR